MVQNRPERIKAAGILRNMLQMNCYIITVVSRYAIAAFSLAMVLISSNYLGAQGLGFVSMFVLGITLNQQLSSFFGGSALVYLTPRHNTSSLLLISYTGAIFIHILLIPAYKLVKPFDPEYFAAFFCISIMQAFLGNNLSVLLGKNKVETYNLISIFQVVMQFLIYLLFAWKSAPLQINHYVIASGIATFMALAGSTGAVYNETVRKAESVFPTFRKIIRYSFFAESGNVLQLLSYRLNYFIINKFSGLAAVGEFSLAVQLTESLRIFSKGIATVEYSYYSNSGTFEPRTSITRKSVIYSLIFVSAGLLFLLLLPSSFIHRIFGNDFQHLKTIILILAPGILFLSAGTIITPFFSGQGKHHINALGSAISFAVTLLAALILVPVWGIYGGALVNTLAYTAVAVYLFTSYKKHLRLV